jgi:hypothetical protein
MKKILLILLLPFVLFGQKPLKIIVTTDSYPTETYWTVFQDTLYGDTIAMVPAGHYTSGNTTYIDTIMLPDSINNITFLMRDTYGDGILSPGNFFVTLCEDTIISVPVPNFNTGMFWNRPTPNCMPIPPPTQCVPALVNINLDQFQSETTWEIKDSTGVLIATGGPYPNAPDYEPQFHPVCIPTGQLTFTIYDSYGDGLAGSLWGGQDGSYYLMQCGDTLVYGTIADFGSDSTHSFVSDTCVPPPPIPGCMDEDYLEYDPLATVSDSSCLTLKILGCTDSTMFNYDPIANYMDYVDSCEYTLILHDLVGNGWVGSKLEIYQDGDTSIFYMNMPGLNQQFNLQLKAPEEVFAKFFVSAQASNTALECGFTLKNPMGDTVLSVVPPFIIPFYTYEGITYCGTECVEVVEGCMDSTAFNFDEHANTSDDCYYYPGCISPAYLEYHVDTTNGYYTDINVQDSCETLVVFGCMDSTMFNYDPSANVNNGCIPIILGCMESLAFNFNPLANTPDTCLPFIYGCIDPTMFNYDNTANTSDGSCVPYIYGCTDSTSFNYDASANTDNGSCIEIVQGCMDPDAWNYNPEANINHGHDSLGCLYAADWCINGSGNPFFLNDECYAWVIDVDDYCCEIAWDTVCQSTYDYCQGTWIGPPLTRSIEENLIVYPNPTNGIININKIVDVSVYSYVGDVVISRENTNIVDVARLKAGVYMLQITYKNKTITKQIIKN